MAIQEFHYTSAESGLRGSPGFQFVKAPADADPSVLRQVESLVAYEPPRSAPARPTAEDLERMPVSLSYSRLPDGSAVLCNTTYTGLDYSGRSGNFYAHALYLSEGPQALGMQAVEAWRSPSWQHSADEPPRAGPALQPGPVMTTARAQAFCADRHARLACFLSDVLRGFDPGDGKQVIVVEDEADDVAMWLYVACASLPAALAERLTFTTYTRRPYLSPHAVIGISPDADFSFSYAEIAHHYRVHHLDPDRSSPADPLEWAEIAAEVWRACRIDLFSSAYGWLPDPGVVDSGYVDELTGVLATAAAAHGLWLPARGVVSAVTWATSRTGQDAERFWGGLMETAVRRHEDIPLALLGAMCQAASRAGETGTGSLVAVLVSRLVAAVTEEEPDGGTTRWLLARLRAEPELARVVAARTRSGLDRVLSGPLPVARVLWLARLAEALGLEDTLLSTGERILGPALLHGPETDAVAEYLAEHADRHLRDRVLDYLNEVATHEPEVLLAALPGSSPVALWLATADLTGRSVLIVTLDLVRARAEGTAGDNVTAFQRVMTALRSEPNVLPAGAVIDLAIKVVWNGTPVSVREAAELVHLVRVPETVRESGLWALCLALLANSGALDRDVTGLAQSLRQIAARDRSSREEPLVVLIAVTGRLNGVTTLADLCEAVSLLGRQPPIPQKLRVAAEETLLGWYLDPLRLREWSQRLADELGCLARYGGRRLIGEYVRHARERLSREVRKSAELLACCFALWWPETDGGADDWSEARQVLLADVLAPAVKKLGEERLVTAGDRIHRQRREMYPEWRHWLDQQRTRGRRLGLPWLIYKKSP
ncbi:GTPase-associated protein 1-related protein [Nonomuraea sp. NPDC050404]|uniref:GTPase-associated protein 1-related protein n=1 Tax=Nonomuraea sp. NPDC050404 TaxID=3155783 RepID=UPI00340BC399